MLFNSLQFAVFFVVVVSLYFALPHRFRWIMLLAASYYFYMCWKVEYVLLILFSTLVDYTVARMMSRVPDRRGRRKYLAFSLVCNLGILFFYKYFNFLSRSVNEALQAWNILYDAPLFQVMLPVGISFYTFQTLSYSIDVYRGRIPAERHLGIYALYVSFWPQLVAGPIERTHHLLPQFRERYPFDYARVTDGLRLMLWGLFKKVAIADHVAVYVNQVYNHVGDYRGIPLLAATFLFAIQIYCDFSGYTDVARGSALFLGLRLPENFIRPYKATSPAAFWRRWHMTLSSWLRDYVYFPLGGSKVGPLRTYWNLWLTLFLIGIWHGAGWTYVVYGTIHGLAMVLHRYFYKRSGRTKDTVDARWLMLLKIFGTFHFVVLTRILFRADSFASAGDVTSQLLKGTTSLAQISWGLWLVLGVSYLIHWLPQGWVTGAKGIFMRLPAPAQGLVVAGVAAVLVKMAATQVVPYIYFQF